jgi:chromosome segregation ATPase
MISDPLLMQALTSSKSRTVKRAMEVAQTVRVIELERANAELRAEFKQSQIKIEEVEERQGSLRSGYTKLENQCENLHSVAEALKEQKAEAERAQITQVTAAHTRFQDYRVHHCKKLCCLQLNLEKVVNEFGAACLPYPGKVAPSVT